MRWVERVRSLSSRQILLVGLALVVVYAFPGYMSTDSVQQLIEARTGHFSDGHPPLMAAEWFVLDRVVAGPLLVLVLQNAVFLAGLHSLLQRVLSPTRAAWTAIAILLFPPVLTTMAVIWKDSQMAAALVAGTAALVHSRLRVRIGGLALLAAACALRYNALAAAVPLVAILFEWKRPLRWWKRLLVLVAATAVAAATAFGVSRALAVQHVKLTPVFSDVVDVLACTRDRDDADLREVFRGVPLAIDHGIQAHARWLHEAHGVWRIAGTADRLFDYPSTDAQWDALGRAWKELVLGDPGAYLRCHWDDFARMLGLTDEPLRAPVWNLFLEDPHQMPGTDHDASYSRVQGWFGRVFYWLADDTPLFRPWIYAVLALVLLPLLCRDRLTFALFASGLAYELSFFPVGNEPDFRYSHWLIASTCIATVLLFVQRRRTRSK